MKYFTPTVTFNTDQDKLLPSANYTTRCSRAPTNREGAGAVATQLEESAQSAEYVDLFKYLQTEFLTFFSDVQLPQASTLQISLLTTTKLSINIQCSSRKHSRFG